MLVARWEKLTTPEGPDGLNPRPVPARCCQKSTRSPKTGTFAAVFSVDRTPSVENLQVFGPTGRLRRFLVLRLYQGFLNPLDGRIAMFANSRLAGLLITAGIVGTTSPVVAAPLLELTVGDNAYVGKALAHDESVCWLAQQDGRVTEVSLKDVTSFRTVDKKFRSMKTIDIRNQLRREFGRGWEITSTGHYLVCAPKGRARSFAKSFEDLYRSFRSYFSRRGFQLPQPEFPMVAVVYPTVNEFAANCAKDGVRYVPGLKGYYHRLTNRTNLFESGNGNLAAATPEETTGHGLPSSLASRRGAVTFEDVWGPTIAIRIWGGVSRTSPEGSSGALSGPSFSPPGQAFNQPGGRLAAPDFRGPLWDGNVQADLKNTIVHEATHQVAYNLGLHSRIGDNPKWITEGLATMFEAEGTRKNTGGKQPKQRLNQERFERFAEYVQRRRKPGSLAKFIMSNRLFKSNVLDAYAQAWAVTFFLAETRSSKHSKFLKTVSARDPMKPYSAEQRLADFQAAFGKDVDRLEVSFLRYMDDLR